MQTVRMVAEERRNDQYPYVSYLTYGQLRWIGSRIDEPNTKLMASNLVLSRLTIDTLQVAI